MSTQARCSPPFRPSIHQNSATRSGAACSAVPSVKTRKNAGLSIEEAARLSGMEVSEWMAIEDGHAPQDINRLRAMADAMEISFDRIAMVVLLCREAWEL